MSVENAHAKASLNSYCKDKGWLFSDMQSCFAARGVCTTEVPILNADFWLCVRSSELQLSPNIRRTVVQVHSMEPHDVSLFNAAKGVIFTHPMQLLLWQKAGFKGHYTIRPIGARKGIISCNEIPAAMTLGFFCGENRKKWKGSNKFMKVVEVVRQSKPLECLMIGRGLSHVAHLGVYEQRAAGVNDYARIDALFCASISPGVPLSVYEACAAGVPVITTPRWFPPGRWRGVHLCENQSGMVRILKKIITDRIEIGKSRTDRACAPFVFEDWIDFSIKYSLINRKIATSLEAISYGKMEMGAC
ncbi:MAG: glycosyltransferase family 4 protein [Stagnimonas sp.]|nr:glycosyltransferase family 4 protein [Stagnimonas sp.]